jgi:hypothetical protein
MRSAAKSLVALAVVSSSMAFTSIASADALPPDAEDCQNKSQGASCMTADGMSTGTCQPEATSSGSCVRGAMEAGTDAQACETAIEVCIPGAASTDAGQTTSDAGGSSTGTDAGYPPLPPDNGRGCTTAGMSAGDVARAGAPFLLAALVPLALRRRKRKTDRA